MKHKSELEIRLHRANRKCNFFSITRDNISSKKTAPAVFRPKTDIHEPHSDSGELDINVQKLKEQVFHIQKQNLLQTSPSTEKKTIIRFLLALWQKLRLLQK